MTDQFNPSCPAIPVGSQGTVLTMHKGAPAFRGGTVTLYNSATPVAIPSSGSFANNGAVSGLSAFSTVYPAIYLFFPANAIFLGSGAGFYYTQMISATAGIVFNNPLVSGQRPAPIRSPTPFTSTGPGAYAQSVLTQTFVEFVIAAGSLGENGGLEIYNLYSMSNSANDKISNILLGGTSVQAFDITGAASFQNLFWIYNTGRIDRQIQFDLSPTGFGGVGGNNTFTNINTANDFLLSVTGNIADPTDYLVLEVLTARGIVDSA